MTQYAADLQAVREAAARLAPWIHKTPVATCATLDRLSGRSLFFKCENLQKAGAFKFRGASNAVLKLPAKVAGRGVVTHSSGNHAQALALAAKLRGIPAHIVMPRTAAAVKRRAVLEYGARISECEPNQAAREATAAAVLAETGGTLIHPYNNTDSISRQATVALELCEQVSGLDAVLAPVGGGGLVAGIGVVLWELAPAVRLFAAEPKGADDAARSKAAGALIPQISANTLADGLLTSLGQLTWPILRDRVERVITVSEEEIVAAMRLTWGRSKLLIEPSSAVAVAAVLRDEFRHLAGLYRVGTVLSAGTASPHRCPW